ncbi:Pentatricopeptide repeat-containing protein [Raphanus sativus]|nr:Pentatricopeptide repeat-containing protein [Raphanus sativus]
MVDMFSMCGCLDKAREVFESMRRGKNLLVTVGLMRVELFERCCSVDGYDEWMGDLELGKWINGYIYENRVRVDKVVGTTALVDIDAASWTSLIYGLAVNGMSRRAMDLYYKMERVEVRSTFVSLLTACKPRWVCGRRT